MSVLPLLSTHSCFFFVMADVFCLHDIVGHCCNSVAEVFIVANDDCWGSRAAGGGALGDVVLRDGGCVVVGGPAGNDDDVVVCGGPDGNGDGICKYCVVELCSFVLAMDCGCHWRSYIRSRSWEGVVVSIAYFCFDWIRLSVGVAYFEFEVAHSFVCGPDSFQNVLLRYNFECQHCTLCFFCSNLCWFVLWLCQFVCHPCTVVCTLLIVNLVCWFSWGACFCCFDLVFQVWRVHFQNTRVACEFANFECSRLYGSPGREPGWRFTVRCKYQLLFCEKDTFLR